MIIKEYGFWIMEKHEMFEDDYHHYAYDDNGKLVHLCIDEEPIPREKYRCIACERDVYPVEGEKKKEIGIFDIQ